MRLTIFRTLLICAISVAALIFLYSRIPTEIGHIDTTPTTVTVYPQSAIDAAQAYADHCGGRVELSPGGPYVINCDE